METLGEVLKSRREQLRLSLREVEEKIGVSNAYLSQLESQKITRPSPSVLKKISDFYELSYSRLMRLAGHPVSGNQKTIFFRTSVGLEEITKKEERDLLEYLKFLRMRRSGK